jgi:tRNA pseudouridine55 synthase
MLSGILNINKPAGITSFAAVDKVKKLTHERHVGHAGTLDPAATGVLPIAFGQATRLIEYLADSTKVYCAGIELGISTVTYDGSGEIISRKDPSGISEVMVKAALASFQGVIQQVPPMYSALRHNGERLYRMARAGIEIERPPREVNIYRIEIIDYTNPFLTVEIECGKGTYIRSIANDLGEKLGCGAYMKELIRQRVGPFEIADALSLDGLAEACRYGFWECYIYAPDTVLLQQPAAVLNWDKEDAVRKGQKLALATRIQFADGDIVRTYSPDGRFIGIIKYDAVASVWRPEKVFR